MRCTLALALLACGGGDATEVTDTGPTEVEQAFPLPPDIDKLDWPQIFTDAVSVMVAVNAQAPFRAHRLSMDSRALGCPDFWSGPVTVGLETVGGDDVITWYDDCRQADGTFFDGWLSWESEIVEDGDAETDEGRTADGFRYMEANALVGDAEGVRMEFKGEATDSFYSLNAAYGFNRFTYATSIDGTLTGRDIFENSPTPRGYRTDLFMYVTGGDIDVFEARGNVYYFEPQLRDRFDSIEVDMALRGPTGAAPGDCILEPLGWIGVRDPDAYWYDVVFQPRAEENLVDDPFFDEDLSACDGCGRLYIQGVEQEGVDVCIDFSFLFDGGFPLPDPDEYVLPIHSL